MLIQHSQFPFPNINITRSVIFEATEQENIPVKLSTQEHNVV